MRTTVAYTCARILLLVISVILLYLVGARGLLLLALAFLVSGIASFVLLSRQRDVMSRALMARTANGRRRVSEFRTRIEKGARAEDEDLQLPDGLGREGPHSAPRLNSYGSWVSQPSAQQSYVYGPEQVVCR
jgi:uncharacterized protein (DUF58 family)